MRIIITFITIHTILSSHFISVCAYQIRYHPSTYLVMIVWVFDPFPTTSLTRALTVLMVCMRESVFTCVQGGTKCLDPGIRYFLCHPCFYPWTLNLRVSLYLDVPSHPIDSASDTPHISLTVTNLGAVGSSDNGVIKY